MSTITLPNIRVSSDLTVKVRLKDNGVAIDWSTLNNVKASIYSDAQRALAGRCDVSVDAEDPTVLVCQYAANKPQYVGVCRIVVSAKYMGETKTYDKPAFNFVRWTADQDGEQITIDDPDVDVEIEVSDVSSSLLDEAIRAAFTAAEEAVDAKGQVLETEAEVEAAEALRVSAEESRVEAEEGRAEAEAARVDEEAVRVSAEDARVVAENARAAAEDLREGAEDDRAAAETARETAEAARVAAEALRVTAEGSRETDEAAREAQASADHTVATGDHTQAAADHTQAAADHTTAASDHTQAGVDHTRAAADHVTAGEDHAQAQDDHEVMEGYDTRLGSVESEVSQLEAKVDEFTQGKFYGYVADADELPEGDIPGFAYVGTDSPFSIYNFDGTSWTDSGLTFDKIPVGNGEDIDYNSLNRLQFANRVYDAENPNGLGYKILRKDASFASQVTDTNTIYEIRYPFNLNGSSIALPDGCVLQFKGGKISNGIVDASLAYFVAEKAQVFDNITFSGAFKNGSFYPEHFGAIGNGVADDTTFIRQCVKYQQLNGARMVIFGSKYRISDAINYYDNAYNDVSVNIVGKYPQRTSEYTLSNFGGIAVDDGKSLFKNATIRGSIKNVSIVGTRNVQTRFFDTCSVASMTISNGNISNFGVLCYDTGISGVSLIKDNQMRTLYYFAKCENVSAHLVDSRITGNYINGGAGLNDNNCFEFAYYNGSLIDNNFIDYYRTIYAPNPVNIQSAGSINSVSNHYQVFRYFYIVASKNNNISLSSNNDIINWTDPATLQKLADFTPLTYTGKDSQTYNLPPFVFRSSKTSARVSIQNLVVEENVGNLVFFDGAGTQYKQSLNKFTIANWSQYLGSKFALPEGATNANYNGGNYQYKHVETNFICDAASVPTGLVVDGYSSYPYGAKILYGDNIYTCTRLNENGTIVARWVDKFGKTPTSQYTAGASVDRPTGIPAGRTYYDTDLGKMIVWNGTAWVNMDGSALS